MGKTILQVSPRFKVVIVGAEYLTGLGMARALGKKNTHITGIHLNYSPCCRSRYWDDLIYIDDFEEIVSHLVSMGRQSGERAVLFTAFDEFVRCISDHRNLLEPYYLFNLPEKKIVDCFLDKTLFHDWAQKNDFRVPESNVCDSYEMLYKCLAGMSFPVILKPFEKTSMWHKVSPVHKTIYLHNKEQIENVSFDMFEAVSKVLVQQYIPGGDGNIYFCLAFYDHQGKMIADYTGRKLVQWPPLSGSTAVAIGEENAEVSRISNEIFTRANFKGLGSIEFKKSELDGEYYIIEPTAGRNDLQSGLAVAGGVNLAAIAFAELVNDETPLFKAKKALWIDEEAFSYSLLHNREKCLEETRLFKILCFRVAFAYLSAMDLIPFLKLFKSRLKLKMVTMK